MNAGSCPGCGSHQTRDLGAIPPAGAFAGRPAPITAARLALCRRCHLGFRDPQPSRELLADLYAAGSDSAWTITELVRPDWRLAADLIDRIGAGSVLDVGCFDGAFFDHVGPTVKKFGIEINAAAADRAGARGVQIVAPDLHELDELGAPFDCVVAFDVIEHVHDPADFLATVARAVRPGGHVIVATGDFFAPTQRLMGSRYLYTWFQEHIAFVSPRWMAAQAPALGLEIVDLVHFSHHDQGTKGFVTGLAKNALYRVAPRLVARLRRGGEAGEAATPPGPPAWASARDHFLVLLRTPAEPVSELGRT